MGLAGRVELSVSEPWDFVTRHGSGPFKGTLLRGDADPKLDRFNLLVRLDNSIAEGAGIWSCLVAVPRSLELGLPRLKVGLRAECGFTLVSDDRALSTTPFADIDFTRSVNMQGTLHVLSLDGETGGGGRSPGILRPLRAVVTGHLLITLPVLTIIGILALGLRSQVGRWGLVVGAAVAWVWWSVSVPRWRRWALRNGADPALLQDLAQRTGLVWRKGSPLESTEFPRPGGPPKPSK